MRGAEREALRNARNGLARLLAYAPAAHRDALQLGELAVADGTDTLDNTARITVVDDGTVVASRRRINFASTTLAFTIADDPPNEQVNVTVEGGGGGSATTVEVNLGSSLKFEGRFTITDAAISPSSKVLCWQAPGPYTGKGTRADEAIAQPVSVVAVEPLSGSAVVHWQTPPMVVWVPAPQMQQGAATSIPKDPQSVVRGNACRLGRVRGNVKFSYMVVT